MNGRDDAEQYKKCFLFALEVFDYCVLLIDQLASSRNHLVLPGRFGDVHWFVEMLLVPMVSQLAQRFRHPYSIWLLATKAIGSYKRN